MRYARGSGAADATARSLSHSGRGAIAYGATSCSRVSRSNGRDGNEIYVKKTLKTSDSVGFSQRGLDFAGTGIVISMLEGNRPSAQSPQSPTGENPLKQTGKTKMINFIKRILLTFALT